MASAPAARTVYGACPHDCPDTCSMLYSIENGRLIGVRGNPDHPYTRGTLCTKVKDFERHHYNPERLLHPMRRSGPKGSASFERIGWDEALEAIASRWRAIIDEDGPEAILPLSYLGNMGVLNGLNSGDAFFNRLGASICERTFCASGLVTGQLFAIGPTSGVDPESFVHARYIVIWAANVMSTNVHLWPFITEARRRGARLVVIDSYRSRTARQADWHLAPYPGTDGALAMAMMHTIIEEELCDADYVQRYTVGFEELAARAAEWPAERAAGVTGLAAGDIRRLAREYATTQPSVIRTGVALERHRGGGQSARAVCCLPALVGAWRHVGGGVLQAPAFDVPLRADRVSRPDWIRPGTRVVNSLRLGAALTGELALDPPIRSLMVWNANPASQAPEINKTLAGLAREDLFTVVSEHFVTDTAAYADILLPAAMAAEQEDIVTSWGQFYVTYNAKAIEPPGEAIPNVELFRRLARAMGLEDDGHFARDDRRMIEDAVDWGAPAAGGETMDGLAGRGYMRLAVGGADDRAPHAEGDFPTPSGKCEFRSSLAGHGNLVVPMMRQLYEGAQGGEPVDPLPGYVPRYEDPREDPELGRRYPLSIVTPKAHGFLNSTYANEAHKLRGQGEQHVLVNPADARERALAEGAMARVFNDRGEFHALAHLSDDVPPGIVVAPSGYWPGRASGARSVNAVSSDAFCGLGHAPSFSDNLVEVAPLAAR